MNVRPSPNRLHRLALYQHPHPHPQPCRHRHQRRPTHFTQPTIQANPHRRAFSTTQPHHATPINHYEVLGVSPDVSKAELKRQFYKLSKETHPDLHKDDATASARFSQISESYSILGHDEKRRRYDRDFFRQSQQSAQRSGTATGAGSYAGSRPASGLSKRRGTFRGAPQSFYAQGGYGKTGRTNNADTREQTGGTFNAAAFTERGRLDAEFNPDPIFRTQTVEDAKRSRRMQAAIDMEAAEIDRNDSFWVRFVIVTGMLVAGITVGSIFVSMKSAPRGGLTRADGSRRDGPKNEWAKG